jgi:hypothetical protein
MTRSIQAFGPERVEVTLKTEEAILFWALLDAGGYTSKAAYARAALLSGHVLDLDKLSEMLGEIGLRLNELIAIITSPDIFRQVDPAIAQFVTAVAALEDYLRDAPGRQGCDRT